MRRDLVVVDYDDQQAQARAWARTVLGNFTTTAKNHRRHLLILGEKGDREEVLC